MKALANYAHTDPEVAKCPFAYYAAMREDDPVHRDPSTGYYWITRYKDVVSVAQDPDTYSSQVELMIRTKFRPKGEKVLADAGVALTHTFVTSDPPEALDIHRLGMQLLPAKKVKALLPHIDELANRLVDDFIGRGEADIIREFSRRLVGTVIGEQLELPLRDLDLFKEWSECTGELMKIGISEDWEAENVAKMVDLVHYLTPHLERAAREGTPGSAIHTLATMNKLDGTPFTPTQRCWMTFFTFTGGNNTTVNMINTDILRLARDPELQDRLRAHPEEIEGFFEEMLRLEGSAQTVVRTPTRDVELGGTLLPKGSVLLLSLGSANRDSAMWGQDAETLNIGREGCRRHLTFGTGPHVCIGMHLARAELRTAIQTLLRRLKNIRLKDPNNPPDYLPLPFHRAIGELHITFETNA